MDPGGKVIFFLSHLWIPLSHTNLIKENFNFCDCFLTNLRSVNLILLKLWGKDHLSRWPKGNLEGKLGNMEEKINIFNWCYGLWSNIMAADINTMAFDLLLWILTLNYGLWFNIMATDLILWPLIQYYGLQSNSMPLIQYYSIWYQYYGLCYNITASDPILLPLIKYYDLLLNIIASDPILWPLIQYYSIFI